MSILTVRGNPVLIFAAFMMFALGGFHVLLAISEFARSTWVLSRLDIELWELWLHSSRIWEQGRIAWRPNASFF